MGRVTLSVTMELMSDAIFGSGYSVPGGEDVAVCQDENGYPYLKGTTLKGLLRESVENWLDWTGGDRSDTNAIFGEEGWQGTSDDRRLQLTEMKLKSPPADPEECFYQRVFTKLENGVVQSGTLRTAMCVRRGLVFGGELICACEDAQLIQNALACIKWGGTMRSRGFGQLRFESSVAKRKRHADHFAPTGCIRYRLRSKTPVMVTDLGRSRGNSYETLGYIPGSAVRGMVMSVLAESNPNWFRENKIALLSEDTRFLDAVPAPEAGLAVIPSVKGFYESKDERVFQSVLPTGEIQNGLKRAKLGDFCTLENGCVRYWSARTSGVTRIRRAVEENEDTRPFRTRYLSADQEFEGYILLKDESLAPEIAEVFDDDIWVGTDRYEGYGRCAVIELDSAEVPAWQQVYGYSGQADTTLYLLAVSPLTMLDERGEPCGLDEQYLARRLKVGQVTVAMCSTSMSEYGSYNRTWQCRAPALRMYDRGSVFKLVCDRVPDEESLRQLQLEGLGVRKAEGFGQILFLNKELFEGLKEKKSVSGMERSQTQTNQIRLRRAKYQWLMDNSNEVGRSGVSRSQVGTIQALCQSAIANRGDLTELNDFFSKNREERGAKHAARFERIERLIRQVLEVPLEETLGTDVPEDCVVKRLELLCMLFDHGRKSKEGE